MQLSKYNTSLHCSHQVPHLHTCPADVIITGSFKVKRKKNNTRNEEQWNYNCDRICEEDTVRCDAEDVYLINPEHIFNPVDVHSRRQLTDSLLLLTSPRLKVLPCPKIPTLQFSSNSLSSIQSAGTTGYQRIEAGMWLLTDTFLRTTD